MRKINKIIFKLLLIFFVLIPVKAESNIVSTGSPEAKITVKIFSSLTCPACANWHTKIFYKMKKDFIAKGLV